MTTAFNTAARLAHTWGASAASRGERRQVARGDATAIIACLARIGRAPTRENEVAAIVAATFEHAHSPTYGQIMGARAAAMGTPEFSQRSVLRAPRIAYNSDDLDGVVRFTKRVRAHAGHRIDVYDLLRWMLPNDATGETTDQRMYRAMGLIHPRGV